MHLFSILAFSTPATTRTFVLSTCIFHPFIMETPTVFCTHIFRICVFQYLRFQRLQHAYPLCFCLFSEDSVFFPMAPMTSCLTADKTLEQAVIVYVLDFAILQLLVLHFIINSLRRCLVDWRTSPTRFCVFAAEILCRAGPVR